jgi:hypothetical protein
VLNQQLAIFAHAVAQGEPLSIDDRHVVEALLNVGMARRYQRPELTRAAEGSLREVLHSTGVEIELSPAQASAALTQAVAKLMP